MGAGTKNKFLSPRPGFGVEGGGVVGAGFDGARRGSVRGVEATCWVGMKIPSRTTAKLPTWATPSSAISTERIATRTVLQSGSLAEQPLWLIPIHGPTIGERKSFMPGSSG